jgi:hypothetical protein
MASEGYNEWSHPSIVTPTRFLWQAAERLFVVVSEKQGKNRSLNHMKSRENALTHFLLRSRGLVDRCLVLIFNLLGVSDGKRMKARRGRGNA